jgi:hypothetical protein
MESNGTTDVILWDRYLNNVGPTFYGKIEIGWKVIGFFTFAP